MRISPLLRSVLLAAGSSVVLKAYGIAAAFLTSLLLARSIGPDGYGAYAFAISAVTLLSVPSGLGLDRLAVRIVAIFKVDKEWGALRGFIKYSNTLTAIVSIILSALLAVAIHWRILPLDPQLQGGLQAALFLVPVLALTALRQAVLRGLKFVTHGQIPELFLRPTLLLIAVSILSNFRPALLSTASAIWITVIAGFIAFLVGTAVLRVKFASVMQDEQEDSQGSEITASQKKTWLYEALPFISLGLITVANNRADILLLGFLSSPDQVGVFHVASRLSDLCVLALYASNTAAAPYFAELLSSKQHASTERAAKGISSWSFWLTVPVVVVLLLLGPQLLKLFGAEFESGFLVLGILAMAQLFNAAVGSVGTVLNMAGKAKFTSFGIMAGLMVNVITSFVLVPLYGAVGAAWSSALALITWNAVLLYFCIVHVGINPSIFSLPQKA